MNWTTRAASRAPAKINLTLHIRERRGDGYHELESLVAFAGVADMLTFAPDEKLALTTTGPTAAAAGEGHDNLVLRAARHFAENFSGARLGAFDLLKRLPVAAGVGGGSSDAAAALRLLADCNGISREDKRLFMAARATGADVPVCLDPRARMMRGIGEKLGPLLGLPPLFAVLVNPRVPVETKAVFTALGLQPGQTHAGSRHAELPSNASRADALALIAAGRNDLEKPAIACAPVIGGVLEALCALPGARLARMSGSGATCFALFDDCHTAARAARILASGQTGWWIRPTLLR